MSPLGIYLVVGALCALVCGVVARDKGLGVWPMVLMAFLLPPIAVIVVLAIRPNAPTQVAVQTPVGQPTSVADELAKFAKLRYDGTLSPQEFEEQKRRLIG